MSEINTDFSLGLKNERPFSEKKGRPNVFSNEPFKDLMISRAITPKRLNTEKIAKTLMILFRVFNVMI